MTPTKVVIYDAGLIGYEDGLHLQKNIHSGLTEFKLLNRDNNNNLKGAKPDNHLILCEHKPVFTLGKSGKAENLLLDQEQLSDQGIEYFPTNRGGDITFHGPGQIVGYPIFDLDYFYHDVHRYVRDLEEVIILTLKEYNIEGIRVEGLTGVWINDKNGLRKICAIGVHISRWVTMHGFALNVNTDLDYFNGIIPCGISDKNKTVTSMKKELNVEVALHAVKIHIIEKFKEVFGIDVEVKSEK